jgi:CrcB protein
VAGPLSFPWAILGINLVGSFLLGALLSLGTRLSESVVATIAVGFLGAFTTFSTFSNDTLMLLRAGRVLAAVGYVAASVLLGVVAAAGGYFGMRVLS